jgi:hypothetical protein
MFAAGHLVFSEALSRLLPLQNHIISVSAKNKGKTQPRRRPLYTASAPSSQIKKLFSFPEQNFTFWKKP